MIFLQHARYFKLYFCIITVKVEIFVSLTLACLLHTQFHTLFQFVFSYVAAPAQKIIQHGKKKKSTRGVIRAIEWTVEKLPPKQLQQVGCQYSRMWSCVVMQSTTPLDSVLHRLL